MVAVLTGALVLSLGATPPTSSSNGSRVRIEVLSNRADLVSGGDALVEVHLPRNGRATGLVIDVDGRDVTDAFEVRADGRLIGRVEGLALGRNRITATLHNRSGAYLDIINHPHGGPVFSGPQLQPWQCNTQQRGLGPAQDEQCNADPVYEFFYKPADGGGLKAYDPEDPPDDSQIARTTTDEGTTVPYIVRRETGAQNRGVYHVAVLYDPSQSVEPWSPPEAWNQKLYYPFGQGCAHYHQQAPGNGRNVLLEEPLGRGFMVATSTLNFLGLSCNTAVSAETMMMLKERIIEQYGEIRYTFGHGGSGGSIGQAEIANGYPGLLQGLTTFDSFPDVWASPMSEVYDCHLLQHYYSQVSPHLWASPLHQTAVNGHESVVVCAAWEATFGNSAGGNAELNQIGVPDPRAGCGIGFDRGFEEEMYDPDTNPDGCRGTFQDFNVAQLGTRTSDGFAKVPWDNVGVQYGLGALESGQILAEQFVDLNEKIGGLDADWNRQPQRSVADEGALRAAYRSGRIMNDTRQLDEVAIIDVRNAAEGGFGFIHTRFHSWSMRERLERAHDSAPNHVVWTDTGGDPFDTMDRWLAATEADTSDDPLPEQLTRNRPAEAADACGRGDAYETDHEACRERYPYYGSARTTAASGAFVANTILKCQLKSLDPADYPVTFTPVQWHRLEETFPDGVCDWTKPSMEQTESVPWLTYMGGPGGEPLGPPPVSTPFVGGHRDDD